MVMIMNQSVTEIKLVMGLNIAGETHFFFSPVEANKPLRWFLVSNQTALTYEAELQLGKPLNSFLPH